MDNELQQYFDDLENLFGEPGWARLLDDAREEMKGLQQAAIETSQSFDEVMYARGQYDVLARLISLREITEFTRAQHEEDDSADI